MAGDPLEVDRERDDDRTHAIRGKVGHWMRLVRSEYLESPGLHLSRNQVQRFWGLDASTCDIILDALVEGRFLRRTRRGAYVRADGGARE